MSAATADWPALLEKRNVDRKIIKFLLDNGVMSIYNFANYILDRSEIQTGILDKVKEGLETDRTQRMILHELWREAEELERMRISRVARGVQEDDLEDPLPDGTIDGKIDDFNSHHHWKPRLS